MSLEEKIAKARAKHEVLAAQRALVDKLWEHTHRVAEELSLREPAEAWQDPQPSRDEGFTVWRSFTVSTRGIHNGGYLRPNHLGAPVRGEVGAWCLAVSVEKSRSDATPLNADLGDKCWDAWHTWDREGGKLVTMEREFEALIREIVTS